MRHELLSREAFKTALQLAVEERGHFDAAAYVDEYLPGGLFWDKTVERAGKTQGVEPIPKQMQADFAAAKGVKQALLEAIAHELEPCATDRGQALSWAGKVIGVVATFVEWVQAKMSVEASKLQFAGAQPILIGETDRKYFERIGAGTEADPYRMEPIAEGELKMQISHDAEHVRFDFGKPAAWIAMPKSQALTFAFAVLDHCGVAVEMQPVPGTPKDPV